MLVKRLMYILPSSYHSTNKRYPVLYLLHGAHGSEIDWPYKGNAHFTTQAMIEEGMIEDCIVVMPNDGGYKQGTYYLDWYDGSGNFEQYIIYDLLDYVDQNFRTVSVREQRVIAGLSMGGFGAFLLALRNPHLFGAAASLSGVLRPIDYWDQAEVASFVGPKGGPYAQEHDLACLAQSLTATENRPELYFDCGTEDYLYEDNIRFKGFLDSINYPYTYQDFEGSHTWDYWSKHLVDVLNFIGKYFNGKEKNGI